MRQTQHVRLFHAKLLCALLLATCSIGKANTSHKLTRFGQITYADGLADGSIRFISQIRSGHLFILSGHCTYTFDGHTVEPCNFINHSLSNISYINSNEFYAICTSEDDSIYAIDFESKKIVSTGKKRKTDNSCFVNNSTIVASSKGNIYTIEFSDTAFSPKISSLYPIYADALCKIDRNKFAFSSSNGKIYFARLTHNNSIIIVDSLATNIKSKISILNFQNNKLLYGNSREIALFDNTSKHTQKLSFNNKENCNYEFTSFLFSNCEPKIYAGTKNDGVLSFDITKNSYSNWQNSDLFSFGLKSNVVNCLFEDDQKNIWIGADWKGGLQKYSPISNQIDFFTTNIIPSSCNKNEISDFEYLNKNKILLAGMGGVFVFDKSQDTVIELVSSVFGENVPMNVKSLETDTLRGILWIGTDGYGLIKYDLNHKSTTVYRQNDTCNSLSNNAIYDLLLDNNTLWIGTWGGGLDALNIETEKFSNYMIDSSNSAFNVVTDIEKDNCGNLWLSTYGHGLASLAANAHAISFIALSKTGAFNNLFDLFIDSKGLIWCGSATNGVAYHNPQENNSIVIKKSKKGNVQQICSIIEDNRENIWITDDKQLFLLDNNKELFKEKNYSKALELKNISFSIESSFIDSNGLIYFGTNKGFIRFNPQTITIDTLFTKTSILSVLVNNNPIDIKAKQTAPVHILKHQENNITIHYSALHFFNTKEIKYSFFLEGYDKRWKIVNASEQKACYTNLSPGKYTFKILSSNGSDLWNTKAETFSFIIQKPFWHSKWFYLLLSLLLIIGIIGIIRFRILSLKSSKIELERLVKNRILKIKEQSKDLEDKNKVLNKQRIELENANSEIAKQNEKIKSQNENLLTHKQKIVYQTKQITDSIQYARNIQDALLHTRNKFKECFKTSFILYKPQAIVSGDFYWIHKNGSRTYFICADCTGHGVHGAFMSVLCCALLNEIFDKYSDLNPSDIIKLLNNNLNNALRSHASDTMGYDGVELNVIVFDSKKNTLFFSGTGTPLLHKSSNKLKVYPVDTFIIGQKPLITEVNITEISYQKDDVFYVFTDGFTLQRGGASFERFGLARLIEEINLIKEFSFHAQEEYLDNILREWIEECEMQDIEQNDDIIVIGVKIDESFLT